MAYRKKMELMAEAMTFLNSFSLSNYKWFEAGVKTASPTKSDQVTAHKVLGFPSVRVPQVQQIWQATGEEYRVDGRVEEHVAVSC